MRRILGHALGIATLAVGLCSCSGEDPSVEEVEIDVPEIEEIEEPEPAEVPQPASEEPETAPATEEEGEPVALDAEAIQELEDLEETLGDARTAAETYESGSTICEAAHSSLAAMMAAVAERYPDQVAQVPPKGAFVQACERLPEEAQECLLPRHVLSHQDDCRAIAEGLDPEQRAYLEQVLGGGAQG